MAIRRFHYTGRKKIRLVDARVSLYEVEGGGTAFDINLDLSDYDLPGESSVFVEAYRQTTWMRFSFGTLETPEIPQDRHLYDFESPENVLFRVRVTSTSESQGMLLAEADKIRPKMPGDIEGDSIPLLPVGPDSGLGDQIYSLSIEDQPRLLINDKVGDWRALARDRSFGALVFPAVLREVLVRILHVEEYFARGDYSDWKAQWLEFAHDQPGVSDLPEEPSSDQCDDWIDDVVDAFCRGKMVLSVFIKGWISEGAS